jgi:hypothetical protein
VAAQASVPEPLFTTPHGVEWEMSPNGTKFPFPVTGGERVPIHNGPGDLSRMSF